jgi:hypothetical protein
MRDPALHHPTSQLALTALRALVAAGRGAMDGPKASSRRKLFDMLRTDAALGKQRTRPDPATLAPAAAAVEQPSRLAPVNSVGDEYVAYSNGAYVSGGDDMRLMDVGDDEASDWIRNCSTSSSDVFEDTSEVMVHPEGMLAR